MIATTFIILDMLILLLSMVPFWLMIRYVERLPKQYYLQEYQPPGIWLYINLPSFPVHWQRITYTYRISTKTDTKIVRVWQFPVYWSLQHPYATNSRRTATRCTYIEAGIYFLYLKLQHRRWRKNKIRITKNGRYKRKAVPTDYTR